MTTVPSIAVEVARAAWSLVEAALESGARWREAIALAHDVLVSWQRSSPEDREAVERHWRERAGSALRRSAPPPAVEDYRVRARNAVPPPPDTEPAPPPRPDSIYDDELELGRKA